MVSSHERASLALVHRNLTQTSEILETWADQLSLERYMALVRTQDDLEYAIEEIARRVYAAEAKRGNFQ